MPGEQYIYQSKNAGFKNPHNGKLCTIHLEIPRGNQPIDKKRWYRIEFGNGDRIDACEEELRPIQQQASA